MLTRPLLLAAILAAASGWLPGQAVAQAPDIRNIRPIVMVLMDTSGSMERLGACSCTTTACTECLPNCATGERSRWASALEALTGDFDAYSCVSRDRSIYVGDYDHNYYIPHIEVQPTTQQPNGVLDTYIDRIRFGLMTFDGIGTLSSANSLVASTDWTAPFIAQSEGVDGMYSYGGPKLFNFPGCLTDYRVDNGARSDSPEGGTGVGQIPGNLVSVGLESEDHTLINAQIQSSVLATRPYGPTPIAGMLDDVRYYFNNHDDAKTVVVAGGGGDLYAACRDRFVVLITDGEPNADFRGAPYDCDACVDDDGDPGTPDVCYTCPYQTPEEISADLCQFDAGTAECNGVVDGVYVVGIDVAGAAAVRLDDIAAVGGTTAAYNIVGGDTTALRAALSAAFDAAAPGTTTRTIPAFVNSALSGGTNRQFQFNTGFNIALDAGDPWTGVLERRRFECNGLVVEEKTVSDTDHDRFHVELRDQAAATNRRLFTAIPAAADDLDEYLTGTGESDIPAAMIPPAAALAPVQKNVVTVPLDAAIPVQYFNAVDATERQEILNWVYATPAEPNALRKDNPLGAIYHSSPAVVASPSVDLDDEAYNLYRATAEVANRPTIIYVGSNDGILHAFAAADHNFIDSGGTPTAVSAGEEIWGFVPPMLMQQLRNVKAAHQWMVDGTPVVRDMFIVRAPGDAPTASQFRNILVVGLRGGGNSYFALDVTNPIDPPKFLWQFEDQSVGLAVGTPGLAQVLVQFPGRGLHERAVAILPGGEGVPGVGSCAVAAAAVAPDVNGSSPRGSRKCWSTSRGRQLFVVDIITGLLLRRFDDTLIHSPVTGGVAVFTGDTATIATRAFVTDEDGVIWRLDISRPSPADWELEAFHDMFWNDAWDSGQPGLNPPILSTDLAGKVVVIQATGDIDLLESTAANVVASITENVTFDAGGTSTGFTTIMNWEMPLVPGEQVTGPLELFDSRVFFGTFRSDVSALSSCDYGYSQLCGVNYVNPETTLGGLPDFGLESAPGSGLDTRCVGPFDNEIIMGATVTQRPNCFSGEEVAATDPYLGSRFRVTGQGGGGFQLVAQVGGGGTVAAGASVGEITQDLPPPETFTSVQAWLGATE